LRVLADGISQRRRNRIALAAGGVLVLSFTTAALSLRERPTACNGAEEQLGEAWSAARRDATKQAFEGTALAYADRAWARAATTLDGYATAWIQQHTDACEATRVRGEQSVEMMDARIACLHAARRALAATTDLLANADEQVVERADDLVSALPPVGRCGDLESMLDRVAPPPAALADEVEEIRATLATAASLERAGKYEDAAAAIAPAVARADAIDYAPVQTEMWLLQGTIHERQGRYDDAERAHSAALQSGLSTGQWDEAARAASALVMTVGSFQRDAKRGLDFAPTAKRGLDFAPTAWGLVARASNPALREAELRRVLGNVHRGSGDLVRAEEEFRAALAITLAAPGSDALDVSWIRLALGSVLDARGDLDGAAAELRATIEIRSEHLGADHPRTANARHNLAALLAKRGDLEGARREYEAALEVLARAHGARHPTVAMTRSNLASVLEDLGHDDEALAEKRAVLEIFEESFGPDHPNTASARQNLALAVGRRGHHAEAVAELRKVISALENKLGARHPTIGTVRLNLGMELSDMGLFDDAVAELRTGTSIRIEAAGETSLDAAESRTELARALLRAGRADEALVQAEKSWDVYAKGEGPAQRRAASALMVARTLLATNASAAEVRRYAETARDQVEPDDEMRAKIEAWIAHPDADVATWP
jgi:tetratricopeptide (TPR) repeat protein